MAIRSTHEPCMGPEERPQTTARMPHTCATDGAQRDQAIAEQEDALVMVLMPRSSWVAVEALAQRLGCPAPAVMGMALKCLQDAVEGDR